MKSIKKLFAASVAGLSLVCSPLFADDYSSKGSYWNVSIGGSAIGDIDVSGISSDIEFETGLGLDLGYGYDFGKTRVEGTWVRGQSDRTTWVGYTVQLDTTIDSIMGSIYYDFREDKKWSPFIGASLGSTNVDFDGASASGFSYGIGYGVSYKTSDEVDVFFKAHTTVIPDLTFATVNNSSVTITNGNYTNATIGLRYRF